MEVSYDCDIWKDKDGNAKYVDIYYEDLPIEVVTKYYPATRWEPADYDTSEIEIDYEYTIDLGDALDTAWDNLDDEDYEKICEQYPDFDSNDIEWSVWQQQLNSWLNDNKEYLVKKYAKQIGEYYQDRAIEKAQEEYEPDDDYYDDDYYYEGYNPIEEAKKKKIAKGSMSYFCPPGTKKKEDNVTVNTDAGDVEKGIEFFNNASGGDGDVGTGEAVGEQLSIADALDKLKDIN